MPCVYFVRHGQNQANIDRVLSHRVVDPPLTELGARQARAVAEWFRSRPLAHVYTSPLRRAHETAVAIEGTTGAPVTLLEALREVDVGDLDGRRDEVAWDVYERVVSGWRAGRWDERFPGGEDFHEAFERVADVLREIERRHALADVAVGAPGEILGTVLTRLLRAERRGGTGPPAITVL